MNKDGPARTVLNGHKMETIYMSKKKGLPTYVWPIHMTKCQAANKNMVGCHGNMARFILSSGKGRVFFKRAYNTVIFQMHICVYI